MTERRRSGLLLPLFSFPSSASWGIGEMADLVPMAAWLAGAGQGVLQLLPVSEMAPAQQSPYSAISAMAIDPLFIRVPDVPDFDAIGGEASLDAYERATLEDARAATRIEHTAVRRLKRAALGRAFDRFVTAEWAHDTGRARAFKGFLSEQAWWVEDYAIFRAIHAREDERPWMAWPEPLQRREPAAIDRTRRELAREVLFYQYLQWIADGQWRAARTAAGEVAIFGDLAFMVDTDSADVWSRQRQFRLDASLGVPPDAFSAAGQDWGMPVYEWDAMVSEDFRWLRERARRSANLYDGYRIDHVVGFYRTYGRPRAGGVPFFTPPDEPSQAALGERVLAILGQAGAAIVAEDLGTVPDFVRASLARLGVPGFRVFRWERRWHAPGEPFIDPADYPAASVAASGTHDTETMIAWWDRASVDERRLAVALPTVDRLARRAGIPDAAAADGRAMRDVLLEALQASGSRLLLLPIQDVFGWTDRINVPATITDDNWTFRLPWPCDQLDAIPEARERQARLRAWAAQYQRL